MSKQQLMKQFREVEKACERISASAPTVSHWTVGQQIDHICLVTAKIITSMENHPSDKPGNKFSLLRLIVMGTGRIPRGKAKAPEHVVPQESPDKAHIDAVVAAARNCLERLDGIPETAWFKHVYFGFLNKKQGMRFLYIHTGHHLRIIKDILRAA